METGSCSRRCMPSLRSKATQRRRNVQGSGHGEWALSAAWRQKHRAAHAGRARTVATGSPRAWLLHGGSESRTGRGASHNASASIAPAGSKVGVTRDLRPGRISAIGPDRADRRGLTVRKKRDIRTVSIAGALKTMTKSPLKLVAPATVNRTVTMPRRKPNSVYRTREHLTGAEVDRLIDAAKANRWGHRDATMILVAFRHGLRSSELVDLRWDQIDFTHAVLHVRRAKKGTPATHPVVGDEMRALRKLVNRSLFHRSRPD